MADQSFDIQLLDIHWIQNVDDPTDLCAHGHVYVRIGKEVVTDQNTLDITVSSTALYLMRTLKENYKQDDYASQLLPCCGHFFVGDEGDDFVNICGCPSGIDWTIIHLGDNYVKHISESGQEAVIDKKLYTDLVLAFADRVEQFYEISQTKKIPEDEFDRNGYLAFWREWRKLRNEWP